jgi:hypothetical protein
LSWHERVLLPHLKAFVPAFDVAEEPFMRTISLEVGSNVVDQGRRTGEAANRMDDPRWEPQPSQCNPCAPHFAEYVPIIVLMVAMLEMSGLAAHREIPSSVRHLCQARDVAI